MAQLISWNHYSNRAEKRHSYNWLKGNPALVTRMMGDLFGSYGISGIIFILGAEQGRSSDEDTQGHGQVGTP
jgi:hypothetical protein